VPFRYHWYPVAAEEVRVTFPPGQKDAVAGEMLGFEGGAPTETAKVLGALDPQPFAITVMFPD
jgi:hypothetical protein